MPDNKKIEEVGVSMVEAAFARVQSVLPHLDKNDKGICTDGRIEVYGEEQLTKKALIGEIDVQVKATITKRKSLQPKANVSTEDLKKYARVFHGALYFKVFLHPDLTLDGIFYKQYLPYDINETLSQISKTGQKTISDKFIPLPNDPRQLERLCRDFVRDSQRQTNIPLLIPGEQVDKEISIPDFSEYEITKTAYIDEFPFSLASLANGAYIYGIAQNGERYAVDKLEDICTVETGRECPIGTGTYTDIFMLTYGEDRRGQYLKFGGFLIRLGEKPTVTLTFTGGIRERLRDLRLAKGIQQTSELIIGNRIHGHVQFDDEFYHAVDEQIKRVDELVPLLDRLSISAVWDPSEFNRRDWSNFRQLQRVFIDGETIKHDDFNDELINLNIDIAGARIKVFAKRIEDGTYTLLNPMDTSICFVPSASEKTPVLENRSPVPGLLSLTVEDYRMAANIDDNHFSNCLHRFPVTNKNSEFANQKLLEMLIAYDQGAVCAKQLLKCCRLLANPLFEIEPESRISIINKSQVSRREGRLAREEMDNLQNIIISNTSSNTEKACAYALLDNPTLSIACIKRLSSKERDALYSWPIAKYLPSEPDQTLA